MKRIRIPLNGIGICLEAENNMSKLVEKFENKKVLIWGYGVEGKSTERFINNYCQVAKLEVFEGKIEDLPKAEYDMIIKSPGIPYIYVNEPKITSMTELFLEEFKAQTIGITGTKGKSTTTSMLYKILSDCLDKEVCLLGNIGIPSLDAYEKMSNGAIAVYEMSCHQLANNKVSPHIAVFLNLFEDHLDYYKTRDKYFEAKAHIAYYQDKNDVLYKGESVPDIKTDASVIKINTFDDNKFNLSILGIHNQINADVAVKIAVEQFGCDIDKAIASVEGFKGLPHRLEYVSTINGVSYYDDSISTIPEATLNAIKSIKNVKSVIVGGMDRGIEYDVLVEEINSKDDIDFILCYESGKRIFDMTDKKPNVHYVDDLKAAVALAKKITATGACVMSPAAASYGYFKNFEARGDFFKNCVLED